MLPFFAASQVTIPDEAARWYLERHEMVKFLEQENKTLREILINTEKKVTIQQGIIDLHESDQTEYFQLIHALRARVIDNESLLAEYKKELKKEKRKKRRLLLLIPLTIAGFLT
jgi:hypothetical protein